MKYNFLAETRCHNQKSPVSELVLPDLSRINLLAEQYKPTPINVPDSNSSRDNFLLYVEFTFRVTFNYVGK